MPKKTLLTATADDMGARLDSFVSEHADMTRSAAVKLIENGNVTVGGAGEPKNYKIRSGDIIEITLPETLPCEAQPEDIPLDIIYEDNDVIVINKPSGMVVHPAAGNESATLVNALLYHCADSLSGIGGVARPGIVHRIDKDTSGLLVVAKNDEAHLALQAQLKGHHISRVYHAIVIGNLKNDEGTVDAPIGRHPTDRKKMAVIKDPAMRSRDAVTHYKVIKRFHGFTYVQCELETGRTHQIRVHMASIGHPLLGDPVYGGNKTQFEAKHRSVIHGQCLHAKKLSFTHPKTKANVTFEAPLPPDMESVIDILEKMN